jgi:hypothetical protein
MMPLQLRNTQAQPRMPFMQLLLAHHRRSQKTILSKRERP